MKPTMNLDKQKQLLRAQGLSEDALAKWMPDGMAVADDDSRTMRIANYIGWMDESPMQKEFLSQTTPGDVKEFLDKAGDGQARDHPSEHAGRQMYSGASKSRIF